MNKKEVIERQEEIDLFVRRVMFALNLTKPEAEAAAEIMKHAVALEVPSKIDVEVGDTWGSAK